MYNNWTEHFGKNFSWSNATMVTKGMAPYGVVCIGEIERIGMKLIERGNDPTDFDLEGIAQKVRCPFLVMHGANDRLIPADEAKTLYDKLGTTKKTLKIFAIEEGGAEHCQVDDRPAGINYMADWLSENVFAAK